MHLEGPMMISKCAFRGLSVECIVKKEARPGESVSAEEMRVLGS